MEQIIKTILNSERPIELGLLVILIIGVSAIFLYTKTLRKVAGNHYSKVPNMVEQMLHELQESRRTNHEDHMMMNANLMEIKGKLSK